VAVYFNGKFLVEPQAASKIDDTALESPGIVGLLAVAVLGEGTGGQPTEPLLFATPADAREVLRSGALLQGVLNAFSPSAEVPGASFVYAVRVNPATQAALTLDNGVATDLIDLTSVDYGLYTNNIQIQIEAGTNIGKKISTRLSDVVLVEDDVGENMFSIIYTGAGTPAVIDVDATTLTTTITGGPGSEDLNITLADYDNFEDLANYINTFAGGVYTFTVLASNPQQAPVLMDYVAAQNILVAYTHTQHLQAAVDYFNSAGNPFVTAVRKAAVGAQLGNISYTPLAGAIEGVTTNTSWQDALDALNDVRVRALTPMSGDAAIHTMGDTHCQQQSLPGGTSPRRQIVGGTAGETVAQVKTRAANLNSDRTAIVYPDIDDLDLDGTLQEDWDPFYFAAKVCGATLGAGIGEPLTRKTFRLQGLSAKLTAAEKADLLLNGVMPVEGTSWSSRLLRGCSLTTSTAWNCRREWRPTRPPSGRRIGSILSLGGRTPPSRWHRLCRRSRASFSSSRRKKSLSVTRPLDLRPTRISRAVWMETPSTFRMKRLRLFLSTMSCRRYTQYRSAGR
jgi:hypothetical protein